MRTIRHRWVGTAPARAGYGTEDAEVVWHVTVPWEDGPESESHGDDAPQLSLTIEGPDGDLVEDVTLDAGATLALHRALGETFRNHHSATDQPLSTTEEKE